ncbi:MAG: hypothetical protein WB791_04440, partial [Waddliaceae bacterium]
VWPSLQGEAPDDKHRIAHSIMRKVGQAVSNKHQMHMAGISEASHRDDNLYTKIGLGFQIRRPIPKDEGRKLLLECAEELLGEINARTDFQPFLHEYPFPVQNISLEFFVYDEDGGRLYHPEITVFSLHKVNLEFLTKSSKKKHGYFSEEEETYEEAIKLFKRQHRIWPKRKRQMTNN